MARDTFVPRDPAAQRLAQATLAAVLFLAAVGALLTMPQKTGAATRSVTAEAAAQTRLAALPRYKAGRVLQHFGDAGFLGVVLDRHDGALLHVVVAHGHRAVDCNVLRPSVRVTEQSATAVRLVVSGYEYVPKATARDGHGGTTCVVAGSRALGVPLRAALGERRVYAGNSPQSTTVADPSDFPAPSTVPDGYTAGPTHRVSATSTGLVAERAYTSGSDALTIRIGSRYDVLAPGEQTGDSTVDGSYAVITHRTGERCVTWNELSGRVRQVCSTGADPLARTELLEVARSLG